MVVLGAVVIGAGIGAIATGRLALVVAATPHQTWLREYVRLVDPALAANASVAATAASFSDVVSDPALYIAQMAPCASGSDTACLPVIDAALKAAPASGELWLYKARVLARNDGLSDEMLDALRNSYRVAPREGWIASERVVLGLKHYPVLPDDLQADVRGDLALVVATSALAEPLAQAYLADESLRNTATDPINALPAQLIERFVGRVRRAIRDRQDGAAVQ